MAKENFDNELLSEKELDSVTGGALKEVNQIISTISANKYLYKEFKTSLVDIADRNLNLKNMKTSLTEILNSIGIEANLSFYNDKNTYKDKKTGNPLSHDDVIARIKNHV